MKNTPRTRTNTSCLALSQISAAPFNLEKVDPTVCTKRSPLFLQLDLPAGGPALGPWGAVPSSLAGDWVSPCRASGSQCGRF